MVYQSPKFIVKTELANSQAKRHGTGFLSLFVLFWMLGVIFFDKNFAYLRLGPLYITELVLGSLIVFNLSRIRKEELILAGVFLFYLGGGILQNRDLFFSVKDMAWMYYLFFLRFFPRDFPAKYVDVVLYACWVRILIIMCYPLFEGETAGLLIHKYRDSAVVLFLAAYYALKSPSGRLGASMTALLVVVSYMTDYKTLIICLMMSPIIFALRHQVSRIHSPYRLGFAALAILLAIYTGASGVIMQYAVNFLSASISFLGIESRYSDSTALWRAEIWRNALNRLDGWSGVLFGEFPGHNFMNSNYLGVRFFLAGGDQLGVVRSAHNILVQIYMKSGLFGFFIFGWYYFKTVKNDLAVLNIFRILTLILAMTADILEVPSRGPLFYCFFSIIELHFSRANLDPKLNEIASPGQVSPTHAGKRFAEVKYNRSRWWGAKNAG